MTDSILGVEITNTRLFGIRIRHPGSSRQETTFLAARRLLLAAQFGVVAFAFFFVATLASGQARAAEYKIGPQDRLQIRVHEWPALSTQVSVNPEGGFTLPLIGFVKAAGMSAGELERHVSDRLQLQAKLGESPYTSIEIMQFRPFYVSGDVARPGEYPFRPGLTALMAVAISGGLYRNPDAPFLRVDRDALQSEGKISAAESRVCELRTTRARLRAELARQEDVRPDQPLPGERATCDAAVAIERQILKARRLGMARELEGYRNRISIYLDQIKFLKLQIESTQRQRASVDREISGQQALSERGLALSSRLPTLERLSSQIEGDQRGLDTAIARARDNIAAAEAAAGKVENDRETEVSAALAQIEAQLNETTIEIATNRSLVNEANAAATRLSELSLDRRAEQITIRLARRGPAGVTALTVSETDEIAPGDVVMVQRSVMPRSGSSAAERATGGREHADLLASGAAR